MSGTSTEHAEFVVKTTLPFLRSQLAVFPQLVSKRVWDGLGLVGLVIVAGGGTLGWALVGGGLVGVVGSGFFVGFTGIGVFVGVVGDGVGFLPDLFPVTGTDGMG